MVNDFRTVPRFFMMTAVPATIGESEANVVDLSVRGARLQVMKPFAIGANLQFSIETNRERVSTPAIVSWCRMAALSLDDEESDRYLCGINFEDELPVLQQMIDDLMARELAMRIEDARSTERYSVTAQVTGSFGVHSPVRILDLSIRGARIATDRQVIPGTRAALRFRVERKHVDVTADMVWCRPSDRRNGFEVGLSIEGEEPLLRHVIAHLCTHNQARIDLNSLRRKFDPLRNEPATGLLTLV